MKKILRMILGISLIPLAGANAATITVSTDVKANTTWTSDNVYLLSGFIYVTDNAVLTIQPGTVIMGEQSSKGTLIISKGSKIMADGKKNQPIVFTSNQAAGARTYGDWGGLIILGKAPINVAGGSNVIEGGLDATKGAYGGTDVADNSGILRYVRVEFGGIAFQPNNEINGITFGGVGNGTIVDYVQVSYSGDDSFEFFGGTVNCKHLIAFRGWDDDFDTDFGYSGKLQFGVALRDPNIADQSGSNGFESDNDGTGTGNSPFTSPNFSNFSLFGPKVNSTTTIAANFKRAAHIRRNSRTSIFNSVISGFPTGLLIDGTTTEANATNADLQFRNNVIAGCATPLSVNAGSTFDINTWYAANANTTLATNAELMVTDGFNLDAPKFTPTAGSALLTGAAFTNPRLQDAFFTSVAYKGAFGTEDWTSCWAEFAPNNANYTAALSYSCATGIDEISTVSNLNVSPNPTNGISNINFTILKNSDVTISVYDIRGLLVKTIMNEKLTQGNHSVTLDASGLDAGIYYTRLNAANNLNTVKIVVVK